MAMRRISRLSLSCLLELSVIALICSPVFASGGPEVQMVFGAAEISNTVTGASRPLVQGDMLQAGDVIVVEGKGLVVLEEKDGTIRVRVTGGSSLGYDGVTPEGLNQYEVPDGMNWFKVTPGTELDVKTPTLVASVRGTEFGVMVADGIASVAVLSGAVETRDSIGRESMQGAGSSVSVSDMDMAIEEKIEGPRREREKEKESQGKGQSTGQAEPGEEDSAPGKSGDAPGKSGDAPGKSGDAPGKSGDAPGKSGDAPGKSGDAPGKSGDAPGKSGDAPGNSGNAPGKNK